MELKGKWTSNNVQCAICKAPLDMLTKAHVAKHGLTREEYIERYPEHADLKYWPDLPQEIMKSWKMLKYGIMK